MYSGFSLLRRAASNKNSNNQKALYFLSLQTPYNAKGSFSIDDGDGSKNITFKMN